MALSNIFREPRRELTETVVGLAAFVGIIGVLLPADYYISVWFNEHMMSPNNRCIECGMIFIGPIVMLAAFILIIAIHGLGNIICTALDSRGLELRPRRRY